VTKDTIFDHPTRGHVAVLYYDVTNDRFQVVPCDDVDTAIPATAKATVSSALAHGYDGTLWRKLPLLWGYTDRFTQVLSETKSGDGQYSRSSTAVPPGYIHILQIAWIKNESGARGPMYFRPYNGSDYLPVAGLLAPAQNEIATLNGPIVLKPGDFVNLAQDSCLNGDAIMAGIWCYTMKTNM